MNQNQNINQTQIVLPPLPPYYDPSSAHPSARVFPPELAPVAGSTARTAKTRAPGEPPRPDRRPRVCAAARECVSSRPTRWTQRARRGQARRRNASFWAHPILLRGSERCADLLRCAVPFVGPTRRSACVLQCVTFAPPPPAKLSSRGRDVSPVQFPDGPSGHAPALAPMQ